MPRQRAPRIGPGRHNAEQAPKAAPSQQLKAEAMQGSMRKRAGTLEKGEHHGLTCLDVDNVALAPRVRYN
eukprot:14375359-Alexandrium_andersonii.AAC.1